MHQWRLEHFVNRDNSLSLKIYTFSISYFSSELEFEITNILQAVRYSTLQACLPKTPQSYILLWSAARILGSFFILLLFNTTVYEDLY
jgi:hypothetical protein